MEFRVSNVVLGWPNVNRRTYFSWHFLNEDVKKRINEKKMFLYMPESNPQFFDLADVIGLIEKLELVGRELKVKVKLYNNPLAKTFSELSEDAIKIVPMGMGSLDNGIVQKDYELKGFSVVPRNGEVPNV